MGNFIIMAIKHKIQLGAKHLNMEARILKELYSPQLRRMHCKGHGTPVDSYLVYYEHQGDRFPGGYRPSWIRFRIEACCPEFEKRIRDKIENWKPAKR